VALKYLLVDEFWTHVGEFEAEIPDWSIGMTFLVRDGRAFAIVGIVPNPDAEADYVATVSANGSTKPLAATSRHLTPTACEPREDSSPLIRIASLIRFVARGPNGRSTDTRHLLFEPTHLRRRRRPRAPLSATVTHSAEFGQRRHQGLARLPLACSRFSRRQLVMEGT
jgi:hypothetical protein